MNIGEKIETLRTKENMTQKSLAEKLFVSDKTISSWEANRTEPSLEFIVKMSEILNCSIEYLINGEDKKNLIETEIKIKLTEKEYKDLELFMKENATFLNENRQIDTYYQPKNHNFVNKTMIESKEKIREWLRIGKRGNKIIVNYKNWYDTFCDEYEVEINDEKNLEKIFTALEIEKIIEVDKIRKKYYYLEKYEVALDFVKDLGHFIEIEVKKYTKEPTEEYASLLRIIKNLHLNLDNLDKRGYPYYLLENKFKNE